MKAKKEAAHENGNGKASAEKAVKAVKPTGSKVVVVKAEAAPVKAAKAETKPAAKTSQRPVASKPAVVQTEPAAPARRESRRPEAVVKHDCPYTSEELNQWRVELLSLRQQISGDINDLETEAMEQEDGHATPTHMAERGSDAEMQDISLGIAGDEKETIWQIDRALRKIEIGVPMPYGLCEYTKQPIQKQRLQHIPWTPLSIEGATHMEQNGLTLEDVLLDA